MENSLVDKSSLLEAILESNNRVNYDQLISLSPASKALIDEMLYETHELLMYTETNEVTVASAHTHIYDTQNSAGFNLKVASPVLIKPMENALVDLDITGLNLHLEPNEAMFLMPRSSTFKKAGKSDSKGRRGLVLANSIGLIDADYPDVVKANYLNLDPTNEIQLDVGDKIAQGLIINVVKSKFPSKMQKRTGGFGSTDS